MAQSFLPFCAHCEKQIVVPNTSILFCSEKCKRKDQAKPPPIPIQGLTMPCYNSYGITPPLTPYSNDSLLEGPPSKHYVKPLSPTPPRSVPAFEEYEMSRAMASMNVNTETPENSQPSSDTASPVDLTGSPTNSSGIYQPSRRPQYPRALTAGSIPTLSSISTASYTGSRTVPVPTQYQYGQPQRPLPPLHRPHAFSSSPRSIDLVTPYMPAPVSPRTDSATTAYCIQKREEQSQCEKEKKKKKPSSRSTPSVTTQRDSIKTLFNFDAIRGEPYMASVSTTSPDKYLAYSNGSPILARMSPTALHMR